MLLPLLESYNALGRPSFKPISTKEELEKRLDVYKGILAPEAVEYLDSLVNLEFSVLRNDIISEQDRYALSQLDIYNNTFKGCTIGIGTSGATYYIHDNSFVDATTAISGSASVAHANMINGTYTA